VSGSVAMPSAPPRYTFRPMPIAPVARLLAVLAVLLAPLGAWSSPVAARDHESAARAAGDVRVGAGADRVGHWPSAPQVSDERAPAEARRARSHAVGALGAPCAVLRAHAPTAQPRAARAQTDRAPRRASHGWPIRLRAPPA